MKLLTYLINLIFGERYKPKYEDHAILEHTKDGCKMVVTSRYQDSKGNNLYTGLVLDHTSDLTFPQYVGIKRDIPESELISREELSELEKEVNSKILRINQAV